MKRESLFFLLGGFAFGILFGFALFHALNNPLALASGSSSAGVMGSGTSQMGSSGEGVGGAPMVKRINQLRRALDQDPADIAAAVELADLYQRAESASARSVDAKRRKNEDAADDHRTEARLWLAAAVAEAERLEIARRHDELLREEERWAK